MILDFADGAAHRGAIDVHVKNVQKDADALQRSALGLHSDDFTIGRRNRHGPGRYGTLRIAEEIEAKKSEQPENTREPRMHEPCDQSTSASQRQRVIDTI